ncbi:type II secretion system protein GspL [Sulfitobacter noctilucae]|uniref:type II secretion system protein GspL n=1 Tax=Sulfitobacter noctilucae TaxID=1342302 RepID=UPI001267A8C2|nr:type II secretion system protein GspL [Sulfitobacter noctilucae]
MNRENIASNQKNKPSGAAQAPAPQDVGSGSKSGADFTIFDALIPNGMQDAITIIPAELVALHRLTLPMRSARRKAAALPFAIEGELGDGLEGTHVALCGQVGGTGGTLAAAVSTEVMENIIAHEPGARCVPEQLLLRCPDASDSASARWVVFTQSGRALVRASDGTGFAARSDMLPTLWQIAGQPSVDSYGTVLPDGVPAQHMPDALPPLTDPAQLPDLRQGKLRPELGLGKPLKWLAAACVLGIVCHLGIAAADARAQRGIADDLQKVAEAALTPRLPDATAEQPPALIQRQLAAHNQPQRGSGFVPLMNRVSTALAGLPDAVQFRQLSWSSDALRITIETTDLDALQRAEAMLGDAGLRVSSGSATAEAGAARADLTVRP